MGLGFFYDDTVTLYNKSIDKQTGRELWYPTLLENVSLVIKKSTNVDKNGMNDKDVAKLFVNAGSLPKPYIKPIVWKNMQAGDKAAYVTFTPAEDFFVEGDTTDADIPEQGFYEWMRAHHDNVFKVTAADWYKKIMPHFEVGGM